MRPSCLLIRRFCSPRPRNTQCRTLLTLAIETSCDDTSVAVLERHENRSATLHFHSKVTSDNRSYGGVHPMLAHVSHQKHLAGLVKEALQNLPVQTPPVGPSGNALLVKNNQGTEIRQKPDFITVTRGPGMRANLITGIDTAKGLAVAWQVPLLGVNHMQAHAVTPRLVSALEAEKISVPGVLEHDPAFPFLSLLVSGGHTMLVHSTGLCEHEILSRTMDIAVGDTIDKCARDILPQEVLDSGPDVMYGRLLEKFAFPDDIPRYDYTPAATERQLHVAQNTAYDWSIAPPLSKGGLVGSEALKTEFSFSGIGSSVKRIVQLRPGMGDAEMRVLARETMRLAFEHLTSRVLMALKSPEVKDIKTLVVSGGVASNLYLKHIIRVILDTNGYEQIRLVFPPPKFCTDNAAMIAWTGIEMWEAGWRSELDIMALKKWSIDSEAEDGGILGVGGWKQEIPA